MGPKFPVFNWFCCDFFPLVSPFSGHVIGVVTTPSLSKRPSLLFSPNDPFETQLRTRVEGGAALLGLEFKDLDSPQATKVAWGICGVGGNCGPNSSLVLPWFNQ